MTKPRIRAIVPYAHESVIPRRVRESLSRLKKCDEIEVEILEACGASISVNRNQSITKKDTRIRQELNDFDYAMQIDSDIEFQVDDVLRLLKRAKDEPCSIISGFYQFRADQNLGVAGSFKNNYPGHFANEDFLKWNETGLKIVDWVGAGFLLINKEVLEFMDFPWFVEGYVEYRQDGVGHSAWYGEDVGFCIAAKRANYKIFVDCDVKVNHLINKNNLTPDDAYEMFMDNLGKVKGMGDLFFKCLKNIEGSKSGSKHE